MIKKEREREPERERERERERARDNRACLWFLSQFVDNKGRSAAV